jgi:spore maturation protein CgeB
MRVLYCALKYDYGVPARGFSYEHENFYATLASLPNLELTYFPFDEVMRAVGRRALNRELLRTVDRIKPDLCFFVLFTDEISMETLREIRRGDKTLTFNWFADDHWRFDYYSKYWAPCFHWISTTDHEAVDRYRAIGCTNVIHTQWACNSRRMHEPIDGVEQYEVTFIGQPHSHRRKAVEQVRKAGIQIECWGQGWPRGRADQAEMTKLFRSSKINLNFAGSSRSLRWKPVGKLFITRRADDHLRVNRPREFLGQLQSLFRSPRLQIKARNFEIPGAGGFLLTESVDALPAYYVPDREIATYRDLDELVEKIRYYLDHPEERLAIRRAGYERTKNEHTYEHRFQEIFCAIGLRD